MKIKYAIPHVTFYYTENDEPKLRIEDTELFNSFDDTLTELYGIDEYYITTERNEKLEIFTIHFSSNIDKDKLYDAIRSINKEEVERIFNINNPKE